MKPTTYYKSFSFLCLLVWFAPILSGQTITQMNAHTKNGQSFYVKALGGGNLYGGDTDRNPTSQLKQYLKDSGLSARVEAGYEVSPHLELGVAAEYGSYPQIEPNDFDYTVPFKAGQFKDTKRIHGELLARIKFLPDAKVHPFVQLGGNVVLGHHYDEKTFAKTRQLGYGATAGFGAEVELSPKLSFVIESSHNAVFPDKALDSADYLTQFKSDGDDLDFDVLSFYGGGVKFKTGNKPCEPVQILQAEAKGALKVGELGDFMAKVKPTKDVRYHWDFGDGTMDSGDKVQHKFSASGEYTVTFSASNCGGTEIRSFRISVTNPENPNANVRPVLEAASINSINASSLSPKVGEAVQFKADVSGTAPIAYRWNFGDGVITTNGTEISHSYNASAKYTVTLEVQNAAGLDRSSLIMDVKPKSATTPISTPNSASNNNISPNKPTQTDASYCYQITELNAVYFNFGAAQLDDRAKGNLMENIEVLKDCPSIKVRFNGYTDHTEGALDALARQRINQVAQYFQNQGISLNRLQMNFVGQDAENCDKEDPERGCRRSRRVEAIPIR